MNIFLYDELLNPEVLSRFNMPIHFVCFAYVPELKLFRHDKKAIAVPFDAGKRNYKNDKVFGAIFALEEATFYTRILDAYYSCSLTRIGENHIYDLRHRLTMDTIPIQFDSLEELRVYKFKRLPSMPCQVYLGNTHNKALATCLKWNKNRLKDGISVEPFKALYEKEGVL